MFSIAVGLFVATGRFSIAKGVSSSAAELFVT